MPWSGSGTYSLPPAYSPEVNGTVIDATRYNGLTLDVATGITAALAKNGENVPTANLPMGGFKHTGAADANAAGQYIVFNQSTAVGSLTVAALSATTVTAGLGTVGAPSYTFSGDANTGMWSAGANIITWTVGGTAGMQLQASQLTLGTGFVFGANLGAVGTPSYSFNGDLNTGLYSPGADQVAIATAGVQRILAGAAGNVTMNAPTSGNTLNVAQLDGQNALITAQALAGGVATWRLNNTDNTNAASGAQLLIVTGGASAGDPKLSFTVSGATSYAFGIDNSDTDSFVLARGTVLGTTNALRLSNTGNFSLEPPTSGTTLTVGQVSGGIALFTSEALSGGDVIWALQNTSNTASSGAHLSIITAGATAADPSVRFTITGVEDWSIGADNSDNDAFKISSSTSLGGGQSLIVFPDGRVAGTALHNNAGAVTGTTNQYIASGTYTPTITSRVNLTGTGTVLDNFIWIRLGNVVLVNGAVTGVQPTVAGNTCVLGVSFPIASDITTQYGQCSGNSTIAGQAQNAVVYGSVGNNEANVDWVQGNTTSAIHWIQFSYVVN